MRPSPMNPHVANLDSLVTKDLCVLVLAIDLTGELLPKMHSREGEKRTVTVALILSHSEDRIATMDD